MFKKTLLHEKVNFLEVLLNLCNCFGNHCSHIMLKDHGRNSSFLQNRLTDLTEYPLIVEYITCSIALIFS